MTRFLTCLLSLSLLLLAAGQARADLIDFETQAAGRGGSFTGKVDSPLVIGIATFTGGELLKNEIGGVDKTGVYATTSVFGGPRSIRPSYWRFVHGLERDWIQPAAREAVRSRVLIYL